MKPTAAVLPAHQPDAAVLHYDVPVAAVGDLEGISRATPLEHPLVPPGTKRGAERVRLGFGEKLGGNHGGILVVEPGRKH